MIGSIAVMRRARRADRGLFRSRLVAERSVVSGALEERDERHIPGVRREMQRLGKRVFHAIGVRKTHAARGLAVPALNKLASGSAAHFTVPQRDHAFAQDRALQSL